jgi:hypothetical protein
MIGPSSPLIKIQAIKMFLLFYIDHTSLFSSHEKEVYDNLISVVGSEMDIRIRQNVLLIQDKIYNRVNTSTTIVSSGSLAEGLDLPGSDLDIMLVYNHVHILQNVQHMNRSARHSTLLIEEEMEFPGFTTFRSMTIYPLFCLPWPGMKVKTESYIHGLIFV